MDGSDDEREALLMASDEKKSVTFRGNIQEPTSSPSTISTEESTPSESTPSQHSDEVTARSSSRLSRESWNWQTALNQRDSKRALVRSPSAPLHHFKKVTVKNRPQEVFFAFGDVYYHLIQINWWVFVVEIAVLYLFLASLFMAFYALDEVGLAPKPDSLLDLFFFSFGKLTGLGGAYNPISYLAYFLATLQSYLYVLLTAMVTGVFYARFSKPRGRARFSKFAVISTWNGTRCLMIRATNARSAHLVQAQAKLFLLRDEQTAEGSFHARLYDLPLHRDFSPNFSVYTWTIRHTIDESSALREQTAEDLVASGSRILVLLSGVDTNLSDQVHVQHTWLPEEILFDVKFADMVTRLPDGAQVIDFDNFDKIEPAESYVD